MSDIIKVKSVAEFINEVSKCYNNFLDNKKHLFFRGQLKESWGLVPKVMRKDLNFNEKTTILDFHHYSASHSIDYKLDEDIVSLLEDMQHYEIATRLLDWTVAPLHALFFALSACEEEAKEGKEKIEDAVVYVLDPWSYNVDVLKSAHQSYKNHPKIQDAYVYGRALLSTYKVNNHLDFIRKEVERKFSISLKDIDFEEPFAFVSNYTNRRVHSQKGVFTIHGTSSKELKHSKIFQQNSCKIIIDKDYKKEIYEELHQLLYINEYSIYPDLVGMKKLFDRKQGLFNL